MKANDPVRVRKAWTRLIAALIAAVLLLAVSGFGVFKVLGTPKSLLPDWSDTMAAEGSAEEETAPETAQVGDFVEHEIYLILSNFAEGYHGDTVRERYAVVPVNGELVTFCFPQRWQESEQGIADATQELLNGLEQYIDKYIIVRGTVKSLPENVSAELYAWFGENRAWMAQSGLIDDSEDAADSLADYMVDVDAVGRLPVGWVVGLTAAAGVCLLYALFELIRILCGGYAVPPKPEITEDVSETEEPQPEAGQPETLESSEDADI